MSKNKTTNWIIDVLLVVFVASAFLSTIFNRLNAMESDTTNFSASEIAIIGVLGILVLVGLMYRIYQGSIGNK